MDASYKDGYGLSHSVCTVLLPELKQFGLSKLVIIRLALQAKVASDHFNAR